MSAQIVLMLVIFGAAIFTAYGLPHVAMWRARQLEAQKSLMTDFFDAADKLAETDDAPEWMIKDLDNVALYLFDSKIMRKHGVKIATGQFQRFMQEINSEIKQGQAAIEALSPDVRELFWKAVASGVFTMTFNSLIFGAIVRKSVFAAAKEPGDSKVYWSGIPNRQILGAISDLTRHSRVAA